MGGRCHFIKSRPLHIIIDSYAVPTAMVENGKRAKLAYELSNNRYILESAVVGDTQLKI